MELIATIDDPAVIARILEHLGLPGARDGPEPAPSVSAPGGDQPALPFALPECCRRPAGPGGRLPLATVAPWRPRSPASQPLPS